MAEEGTPDSRAVVLGLDAAWGFARSDLTSPAHAAAAGALVDVRLTDQPVTELRIHGVAGSTAPIMLEHPATLQVAGDSVTGFYRRWNPDGSGRPSVPRKLEAYLWGGLTQKPLASAAWLVLSPFMFYNMASFMLLPERGRSVVPSVPGQAAAHLSHGPGHRIAHVLLRLLALAATVQFVSAAATAAVSTVGWQAGANLLPSWLGWYTGWTAGWRVTAALAGVVVTLVTLWGVSVKTASRYEARRTSTRPELNPQWPLTQESFWKGEVLVRRQRSLHLAAACAATALIVALPAERLAAARWAALAFAAATLAVATGLTMSPPADRHAVTLAAPDGQPAGVWAGRSCRIVLACAAAALACSATVLGLSDRQVGPQRGALPGLTGFTLVLLITQLALLLALGATVAVPAWRAGRAPGQDAVAGGASDSRPYLRGGLPAVVAMLAFALGGLLGAVVNIGVARMLSTPVPSGFRYQVRPASLAVPWPIYAFGAAPVGMFCGVVLALVVLYRRYRTDRRRFEPPAGAGPSQVAAAYVKQSAPGTGGDDDFAKNRGRIAGEWAIGLLAGETGVVVLLIAASATVAMAVAEIWIFIRAGGTGGSPRLAGFVWLHGAVSLIALVSVLVVGALVTLLRSAYSNKSDRRIIAAVWDVATFWPRAVHPLAPPCYGERAVPEVVDRIRLLTGSGHRDADDSAELLSDAGKPDLARTRGLVVPCGPVLLTGYSQGSIIAAAAVAQLPDAVRRDMALLTLACPARRVYGRAFPEYFGRDQLDALNALLGGDAVPDGTAGRWRNLVRRSDYIGSWIFRDPEPRLDVRDLLDNIDQPCWDPVILVPDANPTPPPVHRHEGWWQDLRTSELGIYLVGRLVGDRAEESQGATERQD